MSSLSFSLLFTSWFLPTTKKVDSGGNIFCASNICFSSSGSEDSLHWRTRRKETLLRRKQRKNSSELIGVFRIDKQTHSVVSLLPLWLERRIFFDRHSLWCFQRGFRGSNKTRKVHLKKIFRSWNPRFFRNCFSCSIICDFGRLSQCFVHLLYELELANCTFSSLLDHLRPPPPPRCCYEL